MIVKYINLYSIIENRILIYMLNFDYMIVEHTDKVKLQYVYVYIYICITLRRKYIIYMYIHVYSYI
jgi:hypothetical protein